jgi:hypothetical protein
VSIRTHPLVDEGRELLYVDVTCELPELRDLFAVVCDEMLNRLMEDATTPGPTCRTVVDRWQDLLAPVNARVLSREMQAGLLAELHVLEELAKLHPDAVTFWTGPDHARFDFTGRTSLLEVKATLRREKLDVEIHGIHQLDAPAEKTLVLVTERFEPVPTGGEAIPDVVDRLLALHVDGRRLMGGLKEWGYSPGDAEAYTKVRFESLEKRAYLVDGDFPRLVPASLTRPDQLGRISRIRYHIDLSSPPPDPLSDDAVTAAFQSIVEA